MGCPVCGRGPGRVLALPWSLLLARTGAAIAKVDDTHQTDDDGAQHREPRSRRKIARGHFWIGGQAVHLGFVHQEIKRIQPAEDFFIRPVQVSAFLSRGLELFNPFLRAFAQLGDGAELNRLGWTRFRAGRLQAALHPVITEGALLCGARCRIHFDDAKGTSRNTVAAAVASVRLDYDSIEFSADDGAGWTNFKTRGLHAVFADIAHQQPAAVFPVIGKLLDEFDVTPVDAVEPARVIVAVAAERVFATVSGGKLVPFLA